MPPASPLPIGDEFRDADEYVESLLRFVTTSTLFQTLCGGVHILDFLTREPSLFHVVLPEEWRLWLKGCEDMKLLDLLLRTDLESLPHDTDFEEVPPSLVAYVKQVRKHSLRRSHTPLSPKTKLPRQVTVGMVPKKIHEVTNFAEFVNRLSKDVAIQKGQEITHYIDFGSGQNYLGRTLASPPYNKRVVAVESKSPNIDGANRMDVTARLAEREKVLRNKKLFRHRSESPKTTDACSQKTSDKTLQIDQGSAGNPYDDRPIRDLEITYTPEKGKGSIHYIEQRMEDGDLSDVVREIVSRSSSADQTTTASKDTIIDPRLMAISIHSCGNLSHHGIRSLLLNPSVHAIAIVGCCYNLLTERLGPPSYKFPLLRPYLLPLNARRVRESEALDPHGFPMSNRLSTYEGHAIQMNITARMMAVQAPLNWTEKESDSFFTRHFFRALLQRVFLDRGVVSKPPTSSGSEGDDDVFVKDATDPLIIGSLRRACYQSFRAYVRGAVAKLATDPLRGDFVAQKMNSMSDQEIDAYAQKYAPSKKELSVIWSLMAFSAGVVESLIVVDRWLFLREHPDVVEKAWVEAVFDYQQSPRNLVVVGIKK